MASTWRELKIAELGDIHLEHPNTSTEHILKNLREAFPDAPETWDLDLILFSGDTFHRLLSFSNPRISMILRWFYGFLSMCAEHDIVVRMLEGTPSHDWKQSQHFTNDELMVRSDQAKRCDFKYVSTLSIEHIERLGITILYVPDEWKHEPEDVWVDVKKALNEHGLSQVDFTLFHGAFAHQLPEHVPSPKHDPDRFSDITRHYVFAGHIHIRSQYRNILAPGSFDRISHGEEGPKGHLRVTVRKDGVDDIVFVENKNAKVYRTIDCTGLDYEAVIAQVGEVTSMLPIDSRIRLVANKTDPAITNFENIEKLYPTMVITPKSVDSVRPHREAVAQIITPYTPPAITPQNIQPMLLDAMRAKGLSEALIAKSRTLLNEQILRGGS